MQVHGNKFLHHYEFLLRPFYLPDQEDLTVLHNVCLQKEWDVQEKKHEAIAADSNLVSVSNLAADLSKINSDSTAIARNKQFIKNLSKDIYLNEAVNVLREIK